MTKYAPEQNADRPMPLNEKIGRIAQSLTDTLFGRPSAMGSGPDDVPEEVVHAIVRAWRERGDYLPSELFSDPAWEMLLELFHAEIRHRRVSMSEICRGPAASTSTAMRWLKALESHGLVLRRADSDDVESESVELTPAGSAALRSYFCEVVQRPGPHGNR